MIGKRLSRLSAECNRILTLASVIGREFSLATLQRIEPGAEEETLLGALEEAVRVGVLEDQSRAGQVRFRFAHAFFRQTLYEEIFTPRRLRLHQQVARALEQQYATRPEEHAAELAEHFAQSTDPEDLRKAVRYGELAEALWQEHRQLVLDSHDPFLALSSAWSEAHEALLDGRLDDVIAIGRRVMTQAAELESPTAGRVLGHVVFRPLIYLGRAEEALAEVEPRARTIGRPGSGEHALCLAHLGRTEEARSALAAALASFGPAGLKDAPIRALADLLEAAVVLADLDMAARVAPELVNVEGRSAPLASVALPVGQAYALLGDHTAARTHDERALAWATKLRFRPEVALARLGLAELLLEGSPEEQTEAIDHLDFAIEEFRAMKMQPALQRALSHKGLLKA